MEANWLALIVAALSTLAVGFVWYNPRVMGTAWMKETGMTEEKAQQGNMPLIFGLSAVMAFIAAMYLNAWISSDEVVSMQSGAFKGVLTALMIGMPVLVTNSLYELRSLKYMLINIGYWVVALAVMGLIIGVWQ